MRYLVLLVLACFGLVFQSTTFTHLTFFGVKPDLLLIIVLFYSIFHGSIQGGIVGFCLGLLEDLYLGRFIGMNALSKGLTSYLIGLIAGGAFRENLLVPIISVFVGTLFNFTAVFILGKIIGLQWSWGLLVEKGLPLAIYNACLVPFGYIPFYRWTNKENEKRSL